MNKDQLTNVLTTIISMATAWAMGKGYIDNATAASIITVGVTIGISVWHVLTNSQKAKIQTINAADNGVIVVDTKRAAAAGIPPVDNVLEGPEAPAAKPYSP